jgi:hypothetical protein
MEGWPGPSAVLARVSVSVVALGVIEQVLDVLCCDKFAQRACHRLDRASRALARALAAIFSIVPATNSMV